jgi:glycerate 2-kinase
MKKIILAPDSYKETMSAVRICDLMESVIRTFDSQVQIYKIPVADGGEGTIDCFIHAMGGKKVNMRVSGPNFEPVDASYTQLPDGKTAVIEMAQAAGLPLVGDRRNPAATTTYGVGQLIRHAVGSGFDKIILGLGGSCTNDGGVGMAAALDIQFLNRDGCRFVPLGETLDQIDCIDMSHRWKPLEHCTVTAMCDVRTLLCGENGAAAVFGPQKGADDEMVRRLDRNLAHLSRKITRAIGVDVSGLIGGGAAGGMGAGAVAFLDASLKSGIDTVLDTVGFDGLLGDTDLILTGEGKIDGQSSQGKVVCGIAHRAKTKNVPVIAVVGDIGDGIDALYDEGVTAIISINRLAIPFEKARLRCERDLSLTIETLMRLLAL